MKIQLSAKAFVFVSLASIAILCNACTSKKDKEKVTDISLTEKKSKLPEPPPPPQVLPVENKTEKKCFENDGLKYHVSIEWESNGKEINGKVISKELSSEKSTEAAFSGTMEADGLIVAFITPPPVVGDASVWTSKPWKLTKKGKQQKLLIFFNAKNYETQKWQETEYEFETCKN